jgi:hypothetical protein
MPRAQQQEAPKPQLVGITLHKEEDGWLKIRRDGLMIAIVPSAYKKDADIMVAALKQNHNPLEEEL